MDRWSANALGVGQRTVTICYLDGEEKLLALPPGAPGHLTFFVRGKVCNIPIEWEDDAPELGFVRVPVCAPGSIRFVGGK